MSLLDISAYFIAVVLWYSSLIRLSQNSSTKARSSHLVYSLIHLVIHSYSIIRLKRLFYYKGGEKGNFKITVNSNHGTLRVRNPEYLVITHNAKFLPLSIAISSQISIDLCTYSNSLLNRWSSFGTIGLRVDSLYVVIFDRHEAQISLLEDGYW